MASTGLERPRPDAQVPLRWWTIELVQMDVRISRRNPTKGHSVAMVDQRLVHGHPFRRRRDRRRHERMGLFAFS